MSYRSSAEAFNVFMDSTIWEDLLNELKMWLDAVHGESEDPDGKTPDRVLHRLGGNAQAIRRFMLMPEVIRDSIIEDRKEASEE